MPSITKFAFRTGAAAAGIGAFALQKTAEILRALAGDAGQAADRSADRFRAAGEDAGQSAEQGAERLRSMATEQALRAEGEAGDGDGDGGDGGATEVPVERRGARARTVEPLIPAEEAPDNAAAPAGADPEATSGTGPVPRRISNPKAARKVRKRAEQSDTVSRLEVKDAKKRGGRPASAKAENTPSERSHKRAGRQPAPMGSSDDAGDGGKGKA